VDLEEQVLNGLMDLITQVVVVDLALAHLLAELEEVVEVDFLAMEQNFQAQSTLAAVVVAAEADLQLEMVALVS
jgi:hypothetical protein